MMQLPPPQLSSMKVMSPNYAKAPILQPLPKSTLPIKPPVLGVKRQQDAMDYLNELKNMGVSFVREPSNPEVYKNTYEVFNKVKSGSKKGGKFDVKVNLSDAPFDLNNPILDKMYRYDTNTGKILPEANWSKAKAAGAWHKDKKEIAISTDNIPDAYKYQLAHEIGHSLGLGNSQDDEYKADAFAAQFYPAMYHGYNNNPYLKESWQPGFIPPVPIPLPKFPEY